MASFIKLLISIAIPLLVGAISAYFTVTGVESWYQTIQKPSWNPPNWIFGPVWTTLYVMMGVAFWMVWKEDTSRELKMIAVILFGVQLILNFLWSFIFFKLELPGFAFLEILFLWIAILATIFAFAQVNKTAAWLLVPYISWVSFAAILNFTIWRLN